jgi:hypothetical protein
MRVGGAPLTVLAQTRSKLKEEGIPEHVTQVYRKGTQIFIKVAQGQYVHEHDFSSKGGATAVLWAVQHIKMLYNAHKARK